MEDHKIKYDSLRRYAAQPQTGDHLVSWAISDAFFHVPLSPADQLRLAFRVGKRVFLPHVLLFWMKLSPYVFTKEMRPVVAALRLRGMRMLAYLYDFSSTAAGAAPSTKPAATAARSCALALLGRLGFAVHPLKGAATGTTSLPLLGFVLDTECRLILLPPSRQAAVMTAVRVSLVGGRGGVPPRPLQGAAALHRKGRLVLAGPSGGAPLPAPPVRGPARSIGETVGETVPRRPTRLALVTEVVDVARRRPRAVAAGARDADSGRVPVGLGGPLELGSRSRLLLRGHPPVPH